MEEELFKRSIFKIEKLIKYGFQKDDNKYTYKTMIKNNSFEVIITFSNGQIKGTIWDKELDEEYINHRISSQTGEFVNSIREEYEKILLDIKDKCTESKYYVSDQANRIVNKIKDNYQDNPEFLWEDDISSVFRNPKNKKWYGIIMYINKNKLDQEDKMVEVMNVKLEPETIDKLVEQKGYYRAYHMNKKYWISMLLNDSISDEEIMKRIKESHRYTE